jgi:hypothetical protein
MTFIRRGLLPGGRARSVRPGAPAHHPLTRLYSYPRAARCAAHCALRLPGRTEHGDPPHVREPGGAQVRHRHVGDPVDVEIAHEPVGLAHVDSRRSSRPATSPGRLQYLAVVRGASDLLGPIARLVAVPTSDIRREADSASSNAAQARRRRPRVLQSRRSTGSGRCRESACRSWEGGPATTRPRAVSVHAQRRDDPRLA